MTYQITLYILIALLLSIMLWKLFEEFRDWRLFGHRAEHDFSMNLSTLQSLGIYRHTPGLVAIDVRPEAQFEKRHLPGAQNAPFVKGTLKNSKIENLDRSTPILVYCEGGHRSRNALKALEEAGFHSIYHMNRGFMMWRFFGGPLEDSTTEEAS